MTHETKTIHGFLEYRRKKQEPSPDCQVQGAFKNCVRTYEQLCISFRQPADERLEFANVLDLPIHDDSNLLGGINQLPLHDGDLLRKAKTPATKARDKRKSCKIPGPARDDLNWIVVSHSGVVSGIHMDRSGYWTAVCLSTGLKAWFWARWEKENHKIRADNGEWGGLSGYTWFAIMLQPGDLFLMPPGLFHAVYTMTDSLCIGEHFYFPETLLASLEMCIACLKHPELTNEDANPKRDREHFSNLIKVRTCLFSILMLIILSRMSPTWSIRTHILQK